MLLLLSPADPAQALEAPPLRSPVVDRAELLSPAAARRLERELLAYEKATGHQIVVHTTPSLEGLEIEEYSIAIADQWRIGRGGLDNGAILTVAPRERRVRIEVGYGLEGVIPDAIASRIVREVILPELREGSFEAGILAGVAAIEEAARGESVRAPPQSRSRRGPSPEANAAVLFWLAILLLFGFRGLFLLPFLGGPRTYGGTFGGFGRGFGAGRSVGGFSGRGGRFGGGGASGRW